MKPKLNYRSAICLICMAIFSLILLNVVNADDQSPPPGMDKGVWVLKEKKPDFGTAEDTDAYFDNKVDPSEYNVKGSLSWGDDKCSGSEWGTSSWSEIPTVLEPGVEQTTTLTAEVGGSQNCAYRHVSARTALIVNGDKPGPEASISYPTSDPKPDPVSVKVPWKAPWGKIGDKLTVTVVAQVPAATAMHCGFDYIYTYEAPGSQPDQPNVPKQTGSFVLPNPQQENEPPVPSQTDIAEGTTPLPKGSDDGSSSGDGRDGNTNSGSESYVQPCLPCQYGDSGVRFTDISGEVDLRPFCNERAWKTAEIHTTPCVDDHVRTGEDSFAILSFADMTTFVMKPETEIILDTPPQKDSKIKLVSGKIWENVKKMITEGSMEVEMSQAVLGIKGTTIVCEETGSSSTLKVLEGTASFRSKVTGEEILVSAGKMATATENGLSQPQPFDIDAENASWEKIFSKSGGDGSDTNSKKVIFNNWNIGGVDNSPSSATSFTISEPYMITYIDTYHWNDGSGTESGGTIALRDNDGKEYGPWQVETKSGQGGVPNAWWIAHPNEKIPAGAYEIIDSDQSTWSQNSESGGCGFSKVEGYPIKDNSASEGQTIGELDREPEAAASDNDEGKVSGTPPPIKTGNTRSAGKEVGTAVNKPNYFAGWLSNKDMKLTGDFMGLGHDQLLIINRDPVGATDGKIEVFDLNENSVISKYSESYGNRDQLKGWIDDEDLQLAGDFMGLGHDQVMFISRTSIPDKTSPYFGNEWKLMIADFSKGQPPAEILCQLSSDKANYFAGWLSDKDVKLTGDFMGLGHDQLLIINRDPVGATDGKIMILDFSQGSPKNEYWENYEPGKSKDSWLDNEDIQLAGDFMGLGHDQVMFISRTSIPDKTSPYFGNEWKLMIADFSKGQHPAETLFQAGEKANYLAGWLSDKDVRLTGDFMGLGHDQLLILNRDPVGATDGETAVFDFAENSIISKYFELYGSSDMLNGWIDDEDIQLAGDFTNLGYSQVMFISRSPVGDKSSPYLGNNWKLMIADFSKGRPPAEVSYQESSP